MTPQERIAEPIPPKPLLEDLERQLAVLSDGHMANQHAIEATRAELGQQIKQVDDRLIQVDVKLTGKIDALDTRLTGKIDALDARLSLITTHLGIDERPPPSPRGRTQRARSAGHARAGRRARRG